MPETLMDARTNARFRRVVYYAPDGVDQDLDGWGARFQVREHASAVAVLIDGATSGDFLTVITDPEGGAAKPLEILVPVTELATLAPGEYVYDLVVWPADAPDDARVLLWGTFRLARGVSRA